MAKSQGKYMSVGLLALKSWCEETGVRQVDLARILGATRSSVAFWWTGEARPSAWRRRLLSELADIEIADWYTTEEKLKLDRALTRARNMLTDGLKNGDEKRECIDRIERLSSRGV